MHSGPQAYRHSQTPETYIWATHVPRHTDALETHLEVLTSAHKHTGTQTHKHFSAHILPRNYTYLHTHSLYTHVNTDSHRHTSWTKWQIHSPPLTPTRRPTAAAHTHSDRSQTSTQDFPVLFSDYVAGEVIKLPFCLRGGPGFRSEVPGDTYCFNVLGRVFSVPLGVQCSSGRY